jgi:biofilm protein TabA
MILSDLANWEVEKAAFPAALRIGIEYLRNNDLDKLSAGKYEIDGEDIYLLIQETDTALRSERKLESHVKYIDIQYLVKGEEIIGFIRKSENDIYLENELSNPAKDFAIYKEREGETELLLKQGMFAVFFPNDLHRPRCSRTNGSPIKKAVVKVNTSLVF